MQQVHPCLFCRSKGGFDIGRCQSYMVDCSVRLRRPMVLIGLDNQIAKQNKSNALPGGVVDRLPRRNKPQLLVKYNGLVEIICWDANVRHTGQNLRKAHTFVSSAIFTTALTMLALSEMLLSMAFWMSSKSKMLVTMPFRLILPEATASIAMG